MISATALYSYKLSNTVSHNNTTKNITSSIRQKENNIKNSEIVLAQSNTYTSQKTSHDDTKRSDSIYNMIQEYDNSHNGTFSVSLQELDNNKRYSLNYNADKVIITASTYKLFVAYSTLRRIDSGQWKWSDKNISTGRNLAKCFDDMIILSDNACGEALLARITSSKVTAEIREQGLSSSGWSNGLPRTTAADLRIFLTKLYDDELSISTVSRDRLIETMKHNIYKDGVPAGVMNYTVANKVGFLNGLLHDAAIVYAPSKDYVLVIMTNGSSWGDIAELTKKIEALRSDLK